MKQIALTRGLVATVDDEDYERLSKIEWYASASRKGSFYAANRTKKPHQTTYMHRLVLYARRGFEVDHIDGNTLNNCRSNLKLATRKQNACNNKRARARAKRPNPLIHCACGCGEALNMFDSWWRPRQYLTGHNMLNRRR